MSARAPQKEAYSALRARPAQRHIDDARSERDRGSLPDEVNESPSRGHRSSHGSFQLALHVVECAADLRELRSARSLARQGLHDESRRRPAEDPVHEVAHELGLRLLPGDAGAVDVGPPLRPGGRGSCPP